MHILQLIIKSSFKICLEIGLKFEMTLVFCQWILRCSQDVIYSYAQNHQCESSGQVNYHIDTMQCYEIFGI